MVVGLVVEVALVVQGASSSVAWVASGQEAGVVVGELMSLGVDHDLPGMNRPMLHRGYARPRDGYAPPVPDTPATRIHVLVEQELRCVTSGSEAAGPTHVQDVVFASGGDRGEVGFAEQSSTTRADHSVLASRSLDCPA